MSSPRPYSPGQIEPSSGNISPPNIITCPLKYLPPVPTNKPPVCPSNTRTRTRATLPSRLSHKVSRERSSENMVDPSEELYASPQAGRHGKRAATFAGELLHTICITPNSDSSSNFDTDPKYKSLNRDMMDDQPMYEDPQLSGLPQREREGDWEIESDQEDSDLDSVYTATILQNTGGSASTNGINPGVVSSNTPGLNQLLNTGVKIDTNAICSVPLSPTIMCPSSLGSNQLRPNILIPVPIRRPNPNQNARALSPAPVPRKFKVSSPSLSPSPRAQSHVSLQLRGQSPTAMPNLVPLSRVSIDGEYVLPNEAYNRGPGILSPTDELSSSDQPDYIDIA